MSGCIKQLKIRWGFPQMDLFAPTLYFLYCLIHFRPIYPWLCKKILGLTRNSCKQHDMHACRAEQDSNPRPPPPTPPIFWGGWWGACSLVPNKIWPGLDALDYITILCVVYITAILSIGCIFYNYISRVRSATHPPHPQT